MSIIAKTSLVVTVKAAFRYSSAQPRHATAYSKLTRKTPYPKFSIKSTDLSPPIPNCIKNNLLVTMDEIGRSTFSSDELLQMSAQEVRELADTARHSVQFKWFDRGRRQMSEAQELWKPELGFDKPGFSSDELLQMSVQEVQALVDQARLFLRNQFLAPAVDAMVSAQSLWAAELGIPRPAFSVNEQSQIDIVPSFGKGLRSREDLSRLPRGPVTSATSAYPCMICLDAMELGVIEALGTCGHQFHETCMGEWLMQQNACPICRKKFIDSDGVTPQ
jgi:hypothetical protein